MAELLDGKVSLDDSLAVTFVPMVLDRGLCHHDPFGCFLGPQPEPPDSPVLRARHWMNPQPEPPLPIGAEDVIRKPQPDPWLAELRKRRDPHRWLTRWWWIGLPSVEILNQLDRYRVSDTAAAGEQQPARSADELAYRIMGDQALVHSLSRRIGAVLGRHGVALTPEKDYSFVPVVYRRPTFAAELTMSGASLPRIIDRAGQIVPAAWIRPLDGVAPADLLRQRPGVDGAGARSMESES